MQFSSRESIPVAMDPQTDLPDLVEDLEVNIDELSDTLSPLLTTPISTTASSLPLLDKAKLYVLAAYSIESLLYSTLQASGVNAKEHAIFKELGRLKGYFGKIKDIEARPIAPEAPKTRLDVGAAARFIKHGLAGNQKYDLERAERVAKEKARAHLKAQQLNKKFDDSGAEIPKAATPKKRDVEEMEAEELVKEGDDDEVIGGLEEPVEQSVVEQPAPKRQRVSVAASPMDVDSASPASSQAPKKGKNKTKKRGKKNKKGAQSAEASEAEVEVETPEEAEQVESEQPETEVKTKTKSARKKRGKKTKSTDASEVESPVAEEASQPDPELEAPSTRKRNTRSSMGKTTEDAEDSTLAPTRAPKTRSEAFNALLDGSLPEKKKRGRPAKAKK